MVTAQFSVSDLKRGSLLAPVRVVDFAQFVPQKRFNLADMAVLADR